MFLMTCPIFQISEGIMVSSMSSNLRSPETFDSETKNEKFLAARALSSKEVIQLIPVPASTNLSSCESESGHMLLQKKTAGPLHGCIRLEININFDDHDVLASGEQHLNYTSLDMQKLVGEQRSLGIKNIIECCGMMFQISCRLLAVVCSTAQ